MIEMTPEEHEEHTRRSLDAMARHQKEAEHATVNITSRLKTLIAAKELTTEQLGWVFGKGSNAALANDLARASKTRYTELKRAAQEANLM